VIQSRFVGVGTALALGALFAGCSDQLVDPQGPAFARNHSTPLVGTVSLSASGGSLVDPDINISGDEYCNDVSVTVSWTYDDGNSETTATSYAYGSLDVHFNGVEFAEDNAAGVDGLQEGDSFSITTTYDTSAGTTSGTFTAGGMGKTPPSKKPITYHTAPASQAYTCNAV
jgi:hypothetical protein